MDFRKLFQLSRYAPSVVMEEDKKRLEQRERFTGAMLGFALNHDRTFSNHFLKEVCNFVPMDGDKLEADVEPEGCSDLVIQCGKDVVIVVELKIEAKLAPEQNPENDLFWLPGGYGYQLLNRHKGKELHYITLERERSWRKAKQASLRCTSKDWKCLLRSDPKIESAMESAVYDCLVFFGLAEFSFRGICMKAKDGLSAALSICHALEKALAAIDPKWTTGRFEVSRPNGTAQFFGINLTPQMCPNLAQFIKAGDRNVVGWFGYEIMRNKAPEPSVWVYNLPEAITAQVCLTDESKCERENGNLRITPTSDQEDEPAWFGDVLKTISNLRPL